MFIGTSVVPYVYINKPPTGPYRGLFSKPRARLVPTNDGRGRFALASFPSLFYPWLVGPPLSVPTFMEVLRHHHRGGCAAVYRRRAIVTVDDGEWVLTSYLAANAVVLPITGWLSASSRPPQLLPHVDRHFYGQFRIVWTGR